MNKNPAEVISPRFIYEKGPFSEVSRSKNSFVGRARAHARAAAAGCGAGGAAAVLWIWRAHVRTGAGARARANWFFGVRTGAVPSYPVLPP